MEEYQMEQYFAKFDCNKNNLLELTEFYELCKNLFRHPTKKYEIDNFDLVDEIFQVFDKNNDGYIDLEEFKLCWDKWIQVIQNSKSAFLIIDVQNDFIGGTLGLAKCTAKQNGEDVVKPINHLLQSVPFDHVFYSLDWHPADHISFIENVNLRQIHACCPIKPEDVKVFDTVIFEGTPLIMQKLWPRHCVSHSWGAQLHEDLIIKDEATKIYKGSQANVDFYSAFWNNDKTEHTELAENLYSRSITDVYVCGLAYDVCVGASAVDALDLGFRTILIDDCCRGVCVKDIELTKQRFVARGGVIVNSAQVREMFEGQIRMFMLGYNLAMKLKLKK